MISVHTRSKIKCLFLVNPFVHKVSNPFKLSPMIRFVLVVVMDKSYCSMLIKISANHLCKPNFMEVFKDCIQVLMEFKCLPQLVLDSFIESELAISHKCF